MKLSCRRFIVDVMKYPLFPILAAVVLALSGAPLPQPRPIRSICGFWRSMIFTATCGRRRAASRSPIPATKPKKSAVPAGGAEHMATLVRQLRQGAKNTIFVAAGDLIGASPFLSAMFHDEPTIEALSMMGLEIASVGNHEFDEGKDELLRMQNGGCHPTDKCQGPHPFTGATFHYLAASTIETDPARPCFRLTRSGSSTASRSPFIGLTLKDTPRIVSPAGRGRSRIQGTRPTP